MPKGKKPGGDYDGWILRLINKVEDLQHSLSLQKWLDFAKSKVIGSGYEAKGGKLTESQIAALTDMQSKVWEMGPTKLNIRLDYTTRYRGVGGRVAKRVSIGYRDPATGRFTRGTPDMLPVARTVIAFRDAKTGRFTKVTAEKVTVYRNLGGYGQKAGTTVSASKINTEIGRMKENKTWTRSET